MLNELAIKYQCDKSSKHHNYCDTYEWYLLPLRTLPITLLEIGVGGYQYPDKGGNGLRMWRDYFSKAVIAGIDVFKKDFEIPGVDIFQASQTDEPFLKPHVIIDDASHINELTIETFRIHFPHLQSGGLYFVEDAHTSYWEENYGGNPDPVQGKTTMNYFKNLADQLNYETLLAKYHKEFCTEIDFVHFYPKLIVIKKK